MASGEPDDALPDFADFEDSELPQENSFASFANLDDGKWKCDTCSLRWDDSAIQCKACESYKPGFSAEDVAKIEAEKEVRKASTIAMFRSSSDAKPTGFGFGGGASTSGTAFGTGTAGSVVFGFGTGTPAQAGGAGTSGSFGGGFGSGFGSGFGQSASGTDSAVAKQRSWAKVLDEAPDFTTTEKVPVGDVFVHGSGECDQLGLGDDMRERKKPTLLKSLIGKSICEIAVGAMH
ncbi:Rcc1, partial [Symbiodinium sp. CCMP2456]